ncbi:hypothetical protein [Microbulbifer aggregans]|uniref:hypothetical protein n=1 Tax=Microbulbifer aggregans TaxID=1769779 RepID=UPI001CFF2035|nr:hypothetical protein [Microbulbifer aggregans]
MKVESKIVEAVATLPAIVVVALSLSAFLEASAIVYLIIVFLVFGIMGAAYHKFVVTRYQNGGVAGVLLLQWLLGQVVVGSLLFASLWYFGAGT